MQHPADRPAFVSLAEAFRFWLKLGFIRFTAALTGITAAVVGVIAIGFTTYIFGMVCPARHRRIRRLPS
jgi:hypothetical protein